MKLVKYVMKKLKRMARNIFLLFLGIAVQKISEIFDFGWQIINCAVCSSTPIFINTCIFRQSEIALLLFFVLLLQFMVAHQPQLIESDFHELIINLKVHKS